VEPTVLYSRQIHASARQSKICTNQAKGKVWYKNSSLVSSSVIRWTAESNIGAGVSPRQRTPRIPFATLTGLLASHHLRFTYFKYLHLGLEITFGPIY
jgi:hypothetical protein